MTWTDVVAAACLLAGSLSCLFGAIGILTFPDVVSRLQAATKPQTFGLILIVIGAALRMDVHTASGLLLVVLFQLLTAPVLAQIVGRAAYRADSIRRDTLDTDELADRLHRERSSG